MYVHVDVAHRRRSVGWAADLCPICRDLRAFQVLEVRRVTRVYFVPMGKGSLESHEIMCIDCGTVMIQPDEGYAGLSRRRRDPAKLVELTNPGILDRSEAWFERQQRVARGQLAPRERIAEILGVLRAVEYMTLHRPRNGLEEWATGLAIFVFVLMFFGAVLSWTISSASGTGWRAAFTIGTIITLPLAAWLVFTHSGMAVRRLLTPRLVRALEALEPTQAELEEALMLGRRHGLLSARLLRARPLHQELTRDRSRPVVLGWPGAA